MGNSPYSTLILIVVMVVAFYFLILRPQRRRQQAQQSTLNQLVPGTRVLTGSGMFGTIVEIGTKQAVLEIAPGVELTVLKQAIARVAGPQDEEPGAAADDLEATDPAADDTVTDAPYPPYETGTPVDTTTTFERPGDGERRREDS